VPPHTGRRAAIAPGLLFKLGGSDRAYLMIQHLSYQPLWPGRAAGQARQMTPRIISCYRHRWGWTPSSASNQLEDGDRLGSLAGMGAWRTWQANADRFSKATTGL